MLGNVKGMVLLCLLLCVASGLFAQDIIISDEVPEQNTVITRVLGDQYLNISAGLQIPLFIHNPNPPSGTDAIGNINLNPGVISSIAWGVFLENNFSLGLDVSATYSTDLNAKSFFAVPIGIHADYFFRFFPFELPLHLGVAIDIMSYNSIITPGLLAKAGLSFYWNTFDDWSFGLNLMYWWVAELHFADDNPRTPDPNMTRFGNFLEITLSAMYNF